MRLEGEPVDPAKRYRVTVNSFLAEGGDGYDGLTDGADREGGGQDIEALIAYLGAAVRTPVAEPRARRAGEKEEKAKAP
jgi:5'-nucleotidase